MRKLLFPVLASLPLLLAACGSNDDGESADDFAGRLGGGSAANSGVGQPVNPALADLPQPAPDGKEAVSYETSYVQQAPGGGQDGLTINEDGTFRLVEGGKITEGTWDWLPDGKRLRLNEVDYRPIVLIADGAIYRLTNENVPLNDLTPDRMYAPAE